MFETVGNGKIFAILEKLKIFFSNVTVEPIVFCNFLAIAFFRVAEHSGLYEVICVQNYQQSHHVDCKNLHNYPVVEDLVQQDAASINMYLSLAYLLPAMASDMFWGAWSDRNGRKVNIMLGLTGLLVAAFPYTIVFNFPSTSLIILLFFNILAGLTGYISIIMISSLAYLTDIVPNKETYTVRMAQVFVSQTSAMAIGSFATGALLKVASLSYVIVVTEIVLTVGFIYTFFRIKHIPPLIMRRLVAEKKSKRKSSTIKPTVIEPKEKSAELMSNGKSLDLIPAVDKSCWNAVKDNFVFVGTMYKEVYVTFVRPRFGHRRCYFHLMTVVYLLFFIAEMGLLHGPVLSLYVFRRPFEWKSSDLAFWKGTQAILLMLGNLCGSLLMKRLCKFKDTAVMLVCLTSGICHLTLTAFCNQSWMLYLSIVLGMLANLTIPTIKSFIAQLVEPNEVGKAFTANGVTADLAFVLSTLLFNTIYSQTVFFFAGTVFLFAAVLLAVCFFIVLWVHIDNAKIESNDAAINKAPIEQDIIIKIPIDGNIIIRL